MTPPTRVPASRSVALPAFLAAALALSAPASATAQTWGRNGFDILPLPTGSYFFDTGSFPSYVNDAGWVTGAIKVGFNYQAFVWDGTTRRTLGTLGGRQSFGRGINNLGQVTGVAQISTGRYDAFLWDGVTMRGLGQRSEASAINDAGNVAGYLFDSPRSAFLWDGTTLTKLSGPAGRPVYGTAVNERGEVAGYGVNAAGRSEAMVHDGTQLRYLGLPAGGSGSFATGINESGQVAGFTSYSGSRRAFLHDGLTMVQLDLLGGTSSHALGLTDAAQVLGSVSGLPGARGTRPVLWDGGTGHYLDALVGSGWEFYDALGISGGGTILALGVNPTVNGGAASYVTLRPHPDPVSVVPEPSSVILLATGLVGLGAFAGRRRRSPAES